MYFSFGTRPNFTPLESLLQCNQAFQNKIPDSLLLPLPRDKKVEWAGLGCSIWSLDCPRVFHNNKGHLFSSLFTRTKLNQAPEASHTQLSKAALIKARSDHWDEAGISTGFHFTSWKIPVWRWGDTAVTFSQLPRSCLCQHQSTRIMFRSNKLSTQPLNSEPPALLAVRSVVAEFSPLVLCGMRTKAKFAKCQK